MSVRRDTFAALADPTRRAILELLLDEPSLTAGEIAGHFRDISRPAVSKHLAVLRDAQLVRAREDGREWHYSLEAAPLEEVYEQWLRRFVPLWDESLARLKKAAESPSRKTPRRGSRQRR